MTEETMDARQRKVEDRVLVLETQIPLWREELNGKLDLIISGNTPSNIELRAKISTLENDTKRNVLDTKRDIDTLRYNSNTTMDTNRVSEGVTALALGKDIENLNKKLNYIMGIGIALEGTIFASLVIYVLTRG